MVVVEIRGIAGICFTEFGRRVVNENFVRRLIRLQDNSQNGVLADAGWAMESSKQKNGDGIPGWQDGEWQLAIREVANGLQLIVELPHFPWAGESDSVSFHIV